MSDEQTEQLSLELEGGAGEKPEREAPAIGQQKRAKRRVAMTQALPFWPPGPPGEVWRRSISWPHCLASSEGRVASCGVKIGRIARVLSDGSRDGGGYVVTHHYFEGSQRTIRRCRIVADAWHGPKPEGQEVRHLDGDNTNDRPDNLAYGTRSENARDTRDHGRVRGQKLDAGKVAEVLRDMMTGTPTADTAERLGITPSNVVSIRAGQSWGDVAPELPRAKAWRALERRRRATNERRRARYQTRKTPPPE